MNNPLLIDRIGVFFMDMDTAIEEEVHLNEDASFTIIINSRMNRERQMKAYYHALAHIMNEDFNKEYADDIERAANIRLK